MPSFLEDVCVLCDYSAFPLALVGGLIVLGGSLCYASLWMVVSALNAELWVFCCVVAVKVGSKRRSESLYLYKTTADAIRVSFVFSFLSLTCRPAA